MIAAACVAAAAGCSTVAEPHAAISGTYILHHVTGNGPAEGSLVLTRQGYAERRVRYREADGSLSKEYLARGTVAVGADETLELKLTDAGARGRDPWCPEARWNADAVELRADDGSGTTAVEVYRRTPPP